jgi:hypothetical protein
VTETVGGCRVDPIDTEVEGPVNGSDGLPVILRTPAEFPVASTDGLGAETEARDVHVGASEFSSFPANTIL